MSDAEPREPRGELRAAPSLSTDQQEAHPRSAEAPEHPPAGSGFGPQWLGLLCALAIARGGTGNGGAAPARAGMQGTTGPRTSGARHLSAGPDFAASRTGWTGRLFRRRAGSRRATEAQNARTYREMWVRPFTAQREMWARASRGSAFSAARLGVTTRSGTPATPGRSGRARRSARSRRASDRNPKKNRGIPEGRNKTCGLSHSKAAAGNVGFHTTRLPGVWFPRRSMARKNGGLPRREERGDSTRCANFARMQRARSPLCAGRLVPPDLREICESSFSM